MDARGLLLVFAELLAMAEAQDLTPQGYRGQTLRRGPARVLRAVGFGPWSQAGRILGRTASHRHWLEANELRARLRRAAQAAFADCQVIVAPCAPVAAFAHQKAGEALRLPGGRRAPYAALAQWSALASVCGLPATVVPAGRTPDGLPVGVQIIGPRGADSRTLAVAQAVEEQIGGFEPPAEPAPDHSPKKETPHA
jgi:amidase